MNNKLIGSVLIILGSMGLFLIGLEYFKVTGLDAIKASGWYMIVTTVAITSLSQMNLVSGETK